jgi:hypothetical protein
LYILYFLPYFVHLFLLFHWSHLDVHVFYEFA